MIIDILWKFSLIVISCSLFAALFGVLATVMYKMDEIVSKIKRHRAIRRDLRIKAYNHSYCTKRYFKEYFKNEL